MLFFRVLAIIIYVTVRMPPSSCGHTFLCLRHPQRADFSNIKSSQVLRYVLARLCEAISVCVSKGDCFAAAARNDMPEQLHFLTIQPPLRTLWNPNPSEAQNLWRKPGRAGAKSKIRCKYFDGNRKWKYAAGTNLHTSKSTGRGT